MAAPIISLPPVVGADGRTLAVTFDQQVITTGGSSTLRGLDGRAIPMRYQSGSGTTQIIYFVDGPLCTFVSETITLDIPADSVRNQFSEPNGVITGNVVTNQSVVKMVSTGAAVRPWNQLQRGRR